MNGQAQQFVRRRRDIDLDELEKASRAMGEEMRAQDQMQKATGIQGGFGDDHRTVLGQEKQQAAGDIGKEYESEIAILNEQDKESQQRIDEANKANKWKNWLSLGGMAAGAALAPLTGGTSLAAIGVGAGIGAQAGGIGAGLMGYGDFNAQDVSGLLQGIGTYHNYVGFHNRNHYWPGEQP